MKKFIILSLCLIILSGFNIQQADAIGMTVGDVVLTDSLYGTAIGGITGCAIAVLSDDFADNADYIWRGAALGALAGIAFGFYETRTSMLSNTDGEFKINFPQIRPVIADKFGSNYGIAMDIVQIDF